MCGGFPDFGRGPACVPSAVMMRLWVHPVVVLAALAIVLAPAAAAPDRKPPRIVAAAMIDADANGRADRVRVTYSERIRHLADRDGRYPFAVSGYRIRSIGKASGKALVIVLVEQAEPDAAAAPVIRYGRTRSKPVRDRAGNQALKQVFGKTKAHGHVVSAPPPSAPLDTDKDGTPDTQDCGPKDASIHPGASDTPDLDFVDSNCDGIDGTESDAVFVSRKPGATPTPAPRRNRSARSRRQSLPSRRPATSATCLSASATTGTSSSSPASPSTAATTRSAAGSARTATRTGSHHHRLPRRRSRAGRQGRHAPAPQDSRQELRRANATAYGLRAINSSDLTLQRTVVAAARAHPV